MISIPKEKEERDPAFAEHLTGAKHGVQHSYCVTLFYFPRSKVALSYKREKLRFGEDSLPIVTELATTTIIIANTHRRLDICQTLLLGNNLY